jgi:hypothetical protein
MTNEHKKLLKEIRIKNSKFTEEEYKNNIEKNIANLKKDPNGCMWIRRMKNIERQFEKLFITMGKDLEKLIDKKTPNGKIIDSYMVNRLMNNKCRSAYKQFYNIHYPQYKAYWEHFSEDWDNI